MAKDTVDPSIADDAAAMDPAMIWDQGKDAKPSNQPAGTFQVEISDAVKEEAISSGNPQIHYELVILNGPHKDKVLHKYDGLGSAQQAQISSGQLRRLGIDTKKLAYDAIPAALLELKGKKALINARHRNDFYNIFFVKLIGEGVGARAAKSPAGSTNKL